MKTPAKNSLSLDMRNNCVDVSRILKALAHPQRLMILCYLSDGKKTVGEIEQACDASQSAVSQFLNRMRLEGLVQSEKQAQFVYYEIKDPQVKQLIRSLYKIFCK
ncbi:MAG: winged helix-turn-helix transcriptional regulator [Bdellovibrionaceae bacterium]|nr:winged helix-turn-helix transcriptional regulator [Pseudobdellovibrionaceae bacterium]